MMEKDEVISALLFYVYGVKFPLDFRNTLLYCWDIVLIGV
jgi:hypothetical protein